MNTGVKVKTCKTRNIKIWDSINRLDHDNRRSETKNPIKGPAYLKIWKTKKIL